MTEKPGHELKFLVTKETQSKDLWWVEKMKIEKQRELENQIWD